MQPPLTYEEVEDLVSTILSFPDATMDDASAFYKRWKKDRDDRLEQARLDSLMP